MSVTVHHGDSRQVLKAIPAGSISAVITDPPYALETIVRRFGGPNAAPAQGRAFARMSGRFLGHQWDNGSDAFDPDYWREAWRVLKPGGHVIAASGTKTYHRLACAVEDAGFEIRDMLSWLYATGFPHSHGVDRLMNGAPDAADWQGWETHLKPACEPWVMARKPLAGTVADNVRAHGCGALNVGACQLAGGRWPANLMHDNDPETVAGFPPGAARYFFSAKADALDRHGSAHPTVKPLALMRWLCRLVTPPGGVILDPFAGTGSTGLAAAVEGFDCVLIEREAEFVADINRRLAHLAGDGRHGGQERARRRQEPLGALPLFPDRAAGP
jgi:site-specific DNA-methyltransferase (adenine-specific)